MDELRNNVGGQSTGMANSAPSPLQNAPPQQPQFGTPGSNQPTDFYVQHQPAGDPSAQQATPQNGAQSSTLGAHQNNNDAPTTTVPANADDSDLIEKEWVEKAKAIVEKTRRDPFLQSQEFNRFKTEYLQKRYGKNVGSDGQES